MRLSEAIRLGSMLKPQAFEDHVDGKSCALRAAMDAAGLKDMYGGSDSCNYVAIMQQWPVSTLPFNGCPVRKRCKDGRIVTDVCDAIYHLNDSHRWTREQIADWVETIERSQEQPTVEPLAAEVSQ